MYVAGREGVLGMAIELLSSYWETGSQLSPSTPDGTLSLHPLWTSRHGGLQALGAHIHIAAGGKTSVGSSSEEALFDSGRSVVTCQLLSGVGRLAVLPGAISISCSLRCSQPRLWREVQQKE